MPACVRARLSACISSGSPEGRPVASARSITPACAPPPPPTHTPPPPPHPPPPPPTPTTQEGDEVLLYRYNAKDSEVGGLGRCVGGRLSGFLGGCTVVVGLAPPGAGGQTAWWVGGWVGGVGVGVWVGTEPWSLLLFTVQRLLALAWPPPRRRPTCLPPAHTGGGGAGADGGVLRQQGGALVGAAGFCTSSGLLHRRVQHCCCIGGCSTARSPEGDVAAAPLPRSVLLQARPSVTAAPRRTMPPLCTGTCGLESACPPPLPACTQPYPDPTTDDIEKCM